MFDSYNQNIKINAVSGAILKNHPKSWFERFHLESGRAKNLFVPGSHIVILQMVLCGEREVLAELVYRGELEQKGDMKE